MVNGKVQPEADALTSAPETETATATQPIDDAHHSRRRKSTELVLRQDNLEHFRFMPVMSIDQALERRQAIVDVTKKLMQDGVDFGKIPGAGDKPCLLQPGADKLCNLFGLVIRYEVIEAEEDWTGETHGGEPFFYYKVTGRAYRGDFLMGEGVGSCNSWESKYRWRKAERSCPSCGKENIRKSREGGWYCWAKTGGCGATFKDGDQRIETQTSGRKPNPDPADSVNTILKMSHKRAKVATTINATSASEFFTQDVEDQVIVEDSDPHGLNVEIGNAQYGTREAQQHVAERKIADLRERNTAKPMPPAPKLSGKSGDIKQAFAELRERIGETRYFEEMTLAGVKRDPFELRYLDKIQALYERLWNISWAAERVA